MLSAALQQVSEDADRLAAIYRECVQVAGAGFLEPRWTEVRNLLQQGMGAGLTLFVAADNLGISLQQPTTGRPD